MKDKLYIKSGEEVKKIDSNYKTYLNKMIVVNGSSGTGKTVITLDIMHSLDEYIPVFYVFSPSNGSNGNFTDIVPPKNIFSGKDKKKTLKQLTDIITVQKNKMALYIKANDFDTMKSLYNKIRYVNSKYRSRINGVVNKAEILMEKLNNMKNLTEDEKIGENIKIRKKLKNTLSTIYKECILDNRDILKSEKNLTEGEKLCLKLINFRPNILIILDDCAARIESWSSKSDIIKQIFFEGRQYFITTIITVQSETTLKPIYRDNAMISVFTQYEMCNNFIRRGNRGFSKERKEKALEYSDAIFDKGDDKKKNYKKFVYLNNDPIPFRYICARVRNKTRMGCEALWNLNEKYDDTEYTENNTLEDKLLYIK